MTLKRVLLTALIIFISFNGVWADDSDLEQERKNLEELKKLAPKVYIDCRRCDMNYIKIEIPFVNYVRDRKEADVHVMITTQSTGAGGQEYTIGFIGLNGFSDLNNTLKYVSNKTETRDEIRRGYVSILKMGLVPYAARTPICSLLGVSFQSRVKPTSVEDKWNFWVFSASTNVRLGGEATRSSNSIFGSFSANRVTLKDKLRMSVSGNWDERKYTYDDEEFLSSSVMAGINGTYARSLGEHWSIGGFLKIDRSSYRNVNFAINPAFAIEYNLFPYSESTRRQMRFLYRLQHSYARYYEETVYQKMKEHLFGQSLEAVLELKEPWGTMEASLEGSHYFHNFKYNRVEFNVEFNFRILKGLTLNVDARYERIRDQLNLPLGDASLEEILLRRKELATDYNYSLSVGLSFTFGSIYSNVVNPRFGSAGGDWRRFMRRR